MQSYKSKSASKIENTAAIQKMDELAKLFTDKISSCQRDMTRGENYSKTH